MTPTITAALQGAVIYTATIGAICAVLYIVKAGDHRRADEAHYHNVARLEAERQRRLGGAA